MSLLMYWCYYYWCCSICL